MQDEHGIPSQYWTYSALDRFQPITFNSHAPVIAIEIPRLYAERDILEKGLADCVTYIHALRAKWSRISRQLDAATKLSSKKRKKIQQVNRQLERDIRHRERDEQAFLNNLQACKANIYIAETIACPSTGLLSTEPAFTSGSTRCSDLAESAPTELSWNGWTDDAVVSPFQKHNRNVFFVDEVAPEAYVEGVGVADSGLVGRRHLQQDIQHAGGLKLTIPPVPPNSATTQFSTMTLSPEATIFAPKQAQTFHFHIDPDRSIGPLAVSPSLELPSTKATQRLRTDHDDAVSASRYCSLLSRHCFKDTRSNTWCHNTPQHSPNKHPNKGGARQERTNSL